MISYEQKIGQRITSSDIIFLGKGELRFDYIAHESYMAGWKCCNMLMISFATYSGKIGSGSDTYIVLNETVQHASHTQIVVYLYFWWNVVMNE